MPEAAPAEAAPLPQGGAAADEPTSTAALQDSVLQGAEVEAQVEQVEPHGAFTAEADSPKLQGGPMKAAAAAPGSSRAQAWRGREVGDERVKMRWQRPQTPSRPSSTSAPPPARCRNIATKRHPWMGCGAALTAS